MTALLKADGIKTEAVETDDGSSPPAQGGAKSADASNGDDDICELEHLRKLFIGGLAPYTTEESLKAFYGQWGNVVDVVVMRDPTTKRSRGFGFITYTKSSMVDKAQDNRPHVIDGKTVEAKRALPRPERETYEAKNVSVKKLFVGGLKDNHDEACLQEYFSQFGKVMSVKILTDKTTGKLRGFAFIEFDDYDAVDKAILQKSHSIKYVVVDVKKSIYNYEKQNRQQGMNKNMPPSLKPEQGKMPGQQLAPGGYRQPIPQQPMPPYHQAPPPNYNQWGPPPPPTVMPPHYGYPQPPMPMAPQQQMGGWGYPPTPNVWNAPPPPPPGAQPAPTWHPNQWGCPPPAGPPMPAPIVPGSMPPGAPPPNWQQPPAVPTGAPPAVQPPHQQQQQQQPPPPNFGTGYQQNYGGGPTKHQNNMNSNRMNPYSAPPNTSTYVNQPPPTGSYGSYSGPPNGKPASNSGPVPGPGPGPVANPVPNGASSGTNKYRR